MTNKFFVPQDGTIEDAVAIIQPGGIIKISAGRFILQEPLLIEKSLRLEGEGSGETVVISATNIDLIRVKIGGEFSVEGLCFQYEENMESSLYEDNAEPSSSMLRIDAGIANIFNCKFAGHQSLKSHGISLYGESRGCIKGNEVNNFFFGISFRMNAYAELIGNHCKENHSGIAFFGSSSGSVADNFCRLSKNCGILVRDEASPQIRGNRCKENGAGICFSGSSSGSATENICHLNEESGILARDESSPQISGNHCEENNFGIVFSHSNSGSATENVCRLNKGSGILARDESSPQISGNHCEENNVGIVFAHSSSGSATKNACSLNKDFGIMVSNEASPHIGGNHCEENYAGIVFLNSSSGSAIKNVCHLNISYGIEILVEASPEVSGNRCEENSTGISFSGSASGSATNNVCRLNKSFGIQAIDEASPEISGNRCEENEVGISFCCSTSGSATENVCRLNEKSGIQVTDEASPQVRGNRCEENVTGVNFAGSSSGSATENVCRLNKGFGIHVRDEASPQIRGNRCKENGAGIGFSGSSSGSATENVCRFNEKGGIIVMDEASPEMGDNCCEENDAGIAPSGSTSGLSSIQSDQNETIEFNGNVQAWIDENTNLMWEVKSRENIDYMYVWHKRYIESAPSDGTTGSMSYENKIRDATSYVERLNTNKYAGFTNWRLPTVKELESLIDPDGDNCFIKKPLQKNTAAAYWTDTPSQAIYVYRTKGSDFSGWKDGAAIPAIKIVDFQKPLTGDYAPNKTLWLRCVRSHGNKETTSSLSFEEAKKRAIENPGAIITKSPDGTGYTIRDS